MNSEKIKIVILAVVSIIVFGCQKDVKNYDATGSFEAESTVISTEINGKLLLFNVREGQVLSGNDTVAVIDSTDFSLKKKQVEAQINALLSRKPDVKKQLASLEVKEQKLQKEKRRIEQLLKDDAATTKQLDDAKAEISFVKSQIEATQSQLSTSINGINLDAATLKIQLEQIEHQISKCVIINPIKGIALNTYMRQSEIVFPGKPLYKVADLTYLTLRCFITEDQLTQVRLNQKIRVQTDAYGKEADNNYQGIVTWVSEAAEFTPKTILTKNERANQVYAIKVKVKNDGKLKVGMYGQIIL